MTRRAAVLVLGSIALVAAACSSTTPAAQQSSTKAVRQSVTATPAATASPSAAAVPATRAPSRPVSTSAARRSTRAGHTATTPDPAAGRLPLDSGTGSARQVITVVAASAGSTSATLQAWRRVRGGWARSGTAVHAWLGTAGMTSSPSESRSATPIGSFTLTRAFGRDPDPGTSLPYTRTTPDDWWISQPGPLYNTRQRCELDCAFTRGAPNEHLYYATPAYDHAVVIDYNTRNAPGGVHQGGGSAFFLHQSEGKPTQGCVSIAATQLDRIMRWLDPDSHPRILIGTR